MKILHAYADYGIEAECLERHGDVYRATLEPNGHYGEKVRADATSLPFKSGTFDFGLFHPPCQRWARATPKDARDDYPDLLEDARAEAERLCDTWAIENVKLAPLRDPAVMGGWHFGKPWASERAFETNFPVPEVRQTVDSARHYTNNGYASVWAARKGYECTDYPARNIRKNCVPAFIVELLVESAKRWA